MVCLFVGIWVSASIIRLQSGFFCWNWIYFFVGWVIPHYMPFYPPYQRNDGSTWSDLVEVKKEKEPTWEIEEERWLRAYMVASFGIWWIDLYYHNSKSMRTEQSNGNGRHASIFYRLIFYYYSSQLTCVRRTGKTLSISGFPSTIHTYNMAKRLQQRAGESGDFCYRTVQEKVHGQAEHKQINGA